MLRPRESRDLRLLSSNVVVTPVAAVIWAQDVFGNAVATATFQSMAESLIIDSVAEVELDAVDWRSSTSLPRPSATLSDIPTMNGPISAH